MHAVKLVFSVPSLRFVVIFKAKLNYFTKATPVLFYSACCICFKANILCVSLPCRFNSPGINCDGSGKKSISPEPYVAAAALRQGRDLCGEHHTALGMLVPDITPPSCRLIVSTQLLVSSILFLSQSCHHQHWPPKVDLADVLGQGEIFSGQDHKAPTVACVLAFSPTLGLAWGAV